MSTRLIRMPKKNKTLNLPDYEGIGLNSEMAYIQKARPLQSLSATDLTLPEFKILDAYLARINSHEPEKRTIKIERGALEKILGVSRILKDDLDKRLRHLFQVIEIKDDRKGNGFKLISLFEEAEAATISNVTNTVVKDTNNMSKGLRKARKSWWQAFGVQFRKKNDSLDSHQSCKNLCRFQGYLKQIQAHSLPNFAVHHSAYKPYFSGGRRLLPQEQRRIS